MLAKSIFDEEGRVLLKEGVTLKTVYIKKLQNLGITDVYINDEFSRGIEINEVVSEETRQESKKAISETMQKFIRRGELSLKGIVNSAQSVIDDILAQKEVMFNMVDIRAKDDVLFSHSVSVCALAVITGVNLGYNMAKLKELAVGSLLHDIGMVQIMQKIPGTAKMIVDKTRYREHSKLGYDILNKQSIAAIVKVIALTHHEQSDGKGFPLGLKFDEIHEMVRVVAVCDAFDRIVHGDKEIYDVPAYQAIEFLESSPQLFDVNIVRQLANNVYMYPSGSKVKLNSGEMGVVVKQNKGFSSRPVVRRLGDVNNVELDLSTNLRVFIEEIFED